MRLARSVSPPDLSPRSLRRTAFIVARVAHGAAQWHGADTSIDVSQLRGGKTTLGTKDARYLAERLERLKQSSSRSLRSSATQVAPAERQAGLCVCVCARARVFMCVCVCTHACV